MVNLLSGFIDDVEELNVDIDNLIYNIMQMKLVVFLMENGLHLISGIVVIKTVAYLEKSEIVYFRK